MNSLNNSSIASSDEENNLGQLDQSDDNRSDEELEQSSINHHSDTDKETTSSDTQLSSRSMDNKSE